MFVEEKMVDIYIQPGRTDMRKQINGLAVLVQERMKKNPLSGSLFLFCGRDRRIIKALYWDKTGFCLWQKRLEAEKFPWPVTPEEARKITYPELRMLLSGIDFFRAHKEQKFSEIA